MGACSMAQIYETGQCVIQWCTLPVHPPLTQVRGNWLRSRQGIN